jgi:hypothetical protein
MTTDPALTPDIDAIEGPLPDTPVLLNRKLHPDTDPATLTAFGDDRWELTPGLFESHAPTVRLNFTTLPEPFREHVKHYVWQLINHDAPRRLRDTDAARLALRSIVLQYPRFTAFVLWLDSHGISRFADVTADHLDHYLADVVASEVSVDIKSSRLMEVRRFWSYRSRLPEPMRLQVPPPWDGEEPRDVLDAPRRSTHNRTPRIQTDTIEMLLMWSLRFVETFADDITNAFHEHLELWCYSAVVCDPKFPSPNRRSAKDIRPELIDYLNHLRMTGGSLPGRRDSDGTMHIYWTHLVRLFKTGEETFKVDQQLRTLVEHSGLPISDQLPLSTPITAALGEKPWLTGPIRYSEARNMARRLRTACFVVVAYLSGMRTGEKRAELRLMQHSATRTVS